MSGRGQAANQVFDELPDGGVHALWTRSGGPRLGDPKRQAPVARITPCEIAGQSGRVWALAADQRGTLIEALVDGFEDGPAATPEALLADLSTPRWLSEALRVALQRDPVKAAAEAAVLTRVLARRADETIEASMAQFAGARACFPKSCRSSSRL